MDSLSTDITLLTIGGDEKTACRVKDVTIHLSDGAERMHGPLSWALGQALTNTAPATSWIGIMAEMERLMQEQGWMQPLLFRGQPTQLFAPY